MIQVVAAVIVAIVFFKAAHSQGKSGFGWSFIGLTAVFIPGIVWSLIAHQMILPQLIGRVRSDGEAIAIGLLTGLIGVGFGVMTATRVYNQHLKVEQEVACEVESSTPVTGFRSDKVWHCGCGEINLNLARECRQCGNLRPETDSLEMV